jgi:hypothetical protein
MNRAKPKRAYRPMESEMELPRSPLMKEPVTVDVPRRKPGRPRRYANGRAHITARLTPQTYAAVKRRAEETRRSISEMVEHLVERAITYDDLNDLMSAMRAALERGVTIEATEADVAKANEIGAQLNHINQIHAEARLVLTRANNAVANMLAAAAAKIDEGGGDGAR